MPSAIAQRDPLSLDPAAAGPEDLSRELASLARRAAPSSAGRRLARWTELLLSQVAPRRCPRCDSTLSSAAGAGFCLCCLPPPRLCLRSLGGLPVVGGRFEGPLRQSIHQLKYMARPELAESLARWLCWSLDFLPAESVSPSGDARVPGGAAERPPCLVAVPLHRGRLVERGYNQAGLLANTLGQRLKLRVRHGWLERRRATAAQAQLGAVERAENIAGAFEARGSLLGQRVILVDDVATTGSTLRACAAALREAGARCAGALVVAVAEPRERRD